jgi:hypothetical protein
VGVHARVALWADTSTWHKHGCGVTPLAAACLPACLPAPYTCQTHNTRSDLSLWAYEKLADTKYGVIGIEWRDVPCWQRPNK